MPRKAHPAATPAAAELDAFERQVEAALDHVADPRWLGAHSPLSAPYFLGRSLPAREGGGDDDGPERGVALRQLLLASAARLDDESRRLLHITYFARDAHLQNVGLALAMNMAERTFYRVRLRTVKSLAHALNDAVVPPLRIETPIAPPLLGRAVERDTAVALLRSGRTVYLAGPSGVGKSALGAAITASWLAAQPGTENNVFWYTLRPGFNDRVQSIAFALGYFLHGLGAGSTWRQLVADRNTVNLEQVLGLLRHDIHSLGAAVPLLCFDDVDVLHDDVAEHARVLHLIEGLRALCPLLLAGQRVIVAADETFALEGLRSAHCEDLLAAAGVPALSPALIERLLSYTNGHPALLLLFASLVRSGEEPELGLEFLAAAPSIEALFSRIWRRLDAAERRLLMQLAVFRTPTPLDSWQEQQDVLRRLGERSLVTRDAVGGVQVAHHLRRAAYERIPAEQRPLLHLRAAEVREARAEYVAAMHHALQGRQPARAVWLWFAHREHEISRGRGATALELLREVALTDLHDPRDRTALQLARSELYQLAGRADDAAQELARLGPQAGSPAMAAYVRFTEAQVREMQGQSEHALEHYRSAIDTLSGLPQHHEVLAHLRLGFLHLYRMHDLQTARREVLLARAKADAFLGDIAALGGDYRAALAHLHAAEETVEQHGGDLTTRSRIYSYLGALHGRLGDYDTALGYIERAIRCDQQRGDQVGPLYDRLNRAMVLRLAGRAEESRREALEALDLAQRFRISYLEAGLAAGAAEACYALGDFVAAQIYALAALAAEEEFFRAPACVILALLHQRDGRDQESVRLLDEALENARLIEDRYTEAYVLRASGEVHSRAGRAGDARDAFARALAIYSDLGLSHEADGVREQLAAA